MAAREKKYRGMFERFLRSREEAAEESRMSAWRQAVNSGSHRSEEELRRITDVLTAVDVRIIRESVDTLCLHKYPATEQMRKTALAEQLAHLEHLEPFADSSHRALIVQARQAMRV